MPQLLSGHVVVFTGKLISLSRKEARALVERLGGTAADEVTAQTTMLVMGADGPGASSATSPGPMGAADAAAAPVREKSQKVRRAEELNAQQAAQIEIVSEDEFCRVAGVPGPTELRRQYQSLRDLTARYRQLREDQLRYLVKCGVVRPAYRTGADAFFAFQDVAIIKQAHDEVARGAAFQTVVKTLLSEREGQLSFDFRHDAEPARIFNLEPRKTQPARELPPPAAPLSPDRAALAEEFFRAGSALDDGDASTQAEATAAYRKALELDPCLVAALINLANIHYTRDELVEAQALYERAISIDPDYFEAHFNLGNIHHDLGRFPEAQRCYHEALRLNPSYADAHFYLAVTCEKIGRSQEARPHWLAYRQLAPQGEWVELAKEFSD